jgi:hypothetical protein
MRGPAIDAADPIFKNCLSDSEELKLAKSRTLQLSPPALRVFRKLVLDPKVQNDNME